MAPAHATVIRVKRRSKRRKHRDTTNRVNPNEHQQAAQQIFRSRTFTVDLKQVPLQTYPVQRFVYNQRQFDVETLRTRSTDISIRSQDTIGSTPTEIHSATTEKEEPKITAEPSQSLMKVLSITGLIALTTVLTTILVVVITTTNVNRDTTTTSKPTTVTQISLHWNTTGMTVAGANGTFGSSSTLLHNPAGLSIDSSDALYITDSQNHRIQKYAVGATSGTTVAAQVPGSCTDPSYLYVPNDVLVDSNGNIYVSDTGCERVRVWTSGSVNGTALAGTGSPGSQMDQLYSPIGITRDPSTGVIYIADSINNRIVKYVIGSTNGSLVAGGNGAGVGTTQLYQPNSVYFDASSNSLIIANTLAHNIVRWNLGSNSGTVIAGSSNGSSGSTSELLYEPKDVTLDSQGNLYVADYRNNRIQLFLAGQTNGTTIAGGSSGSTSERLNGPFSIALDSKLNLYVADSNNHRVQKFSRF